MISRLVLVALLLTGCASVDTLPLSSQNINIQAQTDRSQAQRFTDYLFTDDLTRAEAP